jgi:hypothetical protein
VTGGYPEQTEEWIRRREVKYPYCDDMDYSLAGPFDIYGLPHAILVAPNGAVVYSGGSEGVTEELIKEHLRDAVTTPLFEGPEATAAVRAALAASDFVKAREAADALPKDSKESVDARGRIDVHLELRIKGLEAAAKAGDLLGVETLAATLKDAVKDRPKDAERVKAATTRAAEQTDAEKRLLAQKRVRALTVVPASREAGEAAVKELEAIVAAYPGLSVGRVAGLAARFVRRVTESM